MKAKIKWISHGTFPGKDPKTKQPTGKDVDFWHMYLEGTEFSGKKISCFDHVAQNWKAGDETPEFTMVKTGEYFDQDQQTTIENYKMILPKAEGSQAGSKGGWKPQGKSHEEIIMGTRAMLASYAKDITLALINRPQEKHPITEKNAGEIWLRMYQDASIALGVELEAKKEEK